ncbi:hypothetical protein ABGB09_23445 [Streptomyces sp. B8F3]|uniref:hypothetical protein n=1 Tax=Streptomyces sp. B8F3 TaxID=3153573 RepID=UPI00325F7FF7
MAVIVLAAALAAAMALVPSVPAAEGSAADQVRHAFAPRVLAATHRLAPSPAEEPAEPAPARPAPAREHEG